MKIEAYWDINQLSSIKSKKDAIQAFEEEFVHLFLKESRKSIEAFSPKRSDLSSKIYFDMFDMQMAKCISSSDALGLKEYISKAMEIYEKNGK